MSEPIVIFGIILNRVVPRNQENEKAVIDTARALLGSNEFQDKLDILEAIALVVKDINNLPNIALIRFEQKGEEAYNRTVSGLTDEEIELFKQALKNTAALLQRSL